MKTISLSTEKTTKQNLTTQEASDIYGPSVAWFERARWNGTSPPYIKLGRKVLYPISELEKYFADRVRRSTSSTGKEVA